MGKLLDVKALKDGFLKVKIGELTQNVIDSLCLCRKPCDIVMWEDRYQYIHKHIKDFGGVERFEFIVSNIPTIIQSPDYIGVHPTEHGIEYIKRFGDLVVVAVRIRQEGVLALRSVHPLTEKQLTDYIKAETVIKIVDKQD